MLGCKGLEKHGRSKKVIWCTHTGIIRDSEMSNWQFSSLSKYDSVHAIQFSSTVGCGNLFLSVRTGQVTKGQEWF